MDTFFIRGRGGRGQGWWTWTKVVDAGGGLRWTREVRTRKGDEGGDAAGEVLVDEGVVDDMDDGGEVVDI